MSEDKLQILMVEDNPGDFILLRETLREMTGMDYQLVNVATLAEARKSLAENRFDVVLLDLNLPDGKGLGNIAELSETVGAAPILIMTGLDDELLAVEALRKGAQDYLVKGSFEADVFWRAVRYAVERKRIDEKLIQAKEIAEAGTRAKSEFLAHMSHEIRTPLNVILGIADLLKDTKLDETQKKYVDTFKTSGSTLLALINDLLDLSKVEAGKMQIEQIPFNIRILIKNISEFMALAAEKKSNKLLFNVSADIPDFIIGDPQRLRQIIFNLLGNAIKFTTHGDILLTVEIASPSNELKFCIQDSGIGIDAEKLESIFGDFSQLDSSTSRKYGGTGLGLSICSKLVKLWSGSIWVDSEKGQGSKFYFTMPLIPADEAQINEELKVPPNILSDLNTMLKCYSEQSPCKLLIVDDNVDNRMLLKAYLADNRIVLTEAENGQEALELRTSSEYDLVLLDMQMPVMDGYTCAQKIRDWEASMKATHVPILALTAYSTLEDKNKCLFVGCDEYISKPIQKEMLFYLIDQLVNQNVVVPMPVKIETQIRIDASLQTIVPDYLARKKADVEKLLMAIEKKDFTGIEVMGHNMLGTGSPYGFHDISRLGRVLELAAIQKDVPTLTSKTQELSRFLTEVKVTFQ